MRHSLELIRNEQASAEKILEVTRERVAANQELPIEVTRGQLTLARAEERIVKLEDREETLSEQMRDLTGLSDSQSIEVETRKSRRSRGSTGIRDGRTWPSRTIAGSRKPRPNGSRASTSCEARTRATGRPSTWSASTVSSASSITTSSSTRHSSATT